MTNETTNAADTPDRPMSPRERRRAARLERILQDRASRAAAPAEDDPPEQFDESADAEASDPAELEESAHEQPPARAPGGGPMVVYLPGDEPEERADPDGKQTDDTYVVSGSDKLAPRGFVKHPVTGENVPVLFFRHPEKDMMVPYVINPENGRKIDPISGELVEGADGDDQPFFDLKPLL